MARMSMAERLRKSGGATVEKLDDARDRLKEQSKEQTTERPIEHSFGYPEERSFEHSQKPADSLTDRLTDTITHKRAHTLAVSADSAPINSQYNTLERIPTGIPGEDPFFWMTDGQKKVLKFLHDRPVNRTRLEDISKYTGVAYGTVRKALNNLHKYNCITKPQKIRIGPFQGLHIELLENGRRWIEKNSTEKNSLKSGLPNLQDSGQTYERSNEHSLISSSSFLNKSTTTCTDLQSIIDSHPELGYWREKGLKAKLVDSWAVNFSLPHEEIIQGLCYCRFDMVDNNRENQDNIKDVFNWFFKILEKSGFYPKPKDYLSHQQKLIQREQERIAETKRQAAELRKLREDAILAEHELNFEEMMQDPDSDAYRECFEKIPTLFKKPDKNGSISFVQVMKKAYCEINDIQHFKAET